MNRVQTLLIAGIGAILIAVLVVAGIVLVYDEFTRQSEPVTTTTDTIIAEATTIPATATTAPETVDTTTEGTTDGELPAPVVVALPTDTPIPTDTPTNTPIPTDTPIPATNTPEPTSTNPPPPTNVPPTSTPIPPTNTPAPTSPPVDTRGLVLNSFSLEGGSGPYNPGQQIWFNFNIGNTTGGDVPFGAIGVIPVKDGVTRWDMYHDSWSNQVITPAGLVWRDNVSEIGESGSYTLQLGICFDADFNTCKSGGGNWVILSSAPASVN